MDKLYTQPTVVVAYDKNRGIGHSNDIPWMGALPADMRHFKNLTSGARVIMGRKTFESIGRPLPNRQNIVLTRHPQGVEGVTETADYLEAIGQDREDPREVFVIGGGEIYAQYLPMARYLIATEIQAEFECDTFFPDLNDTWSEVRRDCHQADANNKYDYDIVTYERERYLDISKARSLGQLRDFVEIDKLNVCPFCEANFKNREVNHIDNPIHYEDDQVIVTENMKPYTGSKEHYMVIPKRHITSPDQMTPKEHAAMGMAVGRFTDYDNPGGVFYRYGDFSQTAASVAHLHAHIIKPTGDQQVKVSIN